VGVLDATSGRVLRSIAVGSVPWAVAVDAATQRAFVATVGEGTVSVLDTRSGAVLRTVRVGQVPIQVAVNARTRQVFVVNSTHRLVASQPSISMLLPILPMS
jgi:YVTN family beta-propeller protein